jgi:hypothetical protein
MLPNIKENVERNSKTSFLVEKLVKQAIVVVLEGHLDNIRKDTEQHCLSITLS